MADGQTLGVHLGVLARKLARARTGLSDVGIGAAGALDAGLGAGLGAGLDGAAPTFDMPDFGGTSGTALIDPHIRAWRLALARAARDQLKMAVGFSEVTCTHASLTEVLESPMQRALILMLQGRGEGMGLMILSGQMLAALVEILTLTHLSPQTPDEADLRKPTRTDAAMAVEFIDAALAGFETIVAESGAGGDDWAAGYRYAAFIDDPRPLHLMLEDGDYHLMTADLVLEDGSRSGKVYLALPMTPSTLAIPDFTAMDFAADLGQNLDVQDDTFQADLAAQVHEMGVQIDAALAQISLPIDRIMRLAVGEVLPLPLANLDQISLRGLDGFRVAGGRLGQNRGMRALRLTDVACAQRTGMAHVAPAAEGGFQASVPAQVMPNAAGDGASDTMGLGDVNFDALPFAQSA